MKRQPKKPRASAVRITRNGITATGPAAGLLLEAMRKAYGLPSPAPPEATDPAPTSGEDGIEPTTMTTHVYVTRKRKCPFCEAPIWMAKTDDGLVALGSDPSKGTAYQHRCSSSEVHRVRD